jgi:predicted ribosomally synthesized peptide with SipW-like signal peptide
MKRILLSFAMITLTIAGVTSATVAYFNDTAAITGSTFSAGTLNLKIDSDPNPSFYNWSDGFTNPYAYTNLKPGSSGQQILDIKNWGTVGGYATIQLNATTWSALGDNLVFTISFDSDNDESAGWATVASGTLAQFAGNTYTLGNFTGNANNTDGGLTGQKASVKIEWSVPTSAGNNIQGQSVVIDTVFGLEQTP